MKKLALVLLAVFMVSTSAEAQFFKKLKQKVEKKVEDAVIDNVSDKAADEANQSVDKLWETNLENLSMPMGGERIDPAELPASYDFDWQYTLNMDTSQGNMDMTYLLKEDAPYVGIIMPEMADMTMVMDNEKGHMVMFMNSGGTKMLTATKLDLEAAAEGTDMDNPYADIEYQEIAPKEIMGYTCKGYKASTEEYDFTFYVTDEAGISFNDVFSNQKNMPKNFDPEWLKNGTGLMMEMNMTDKKDPKKNVTMTCTSIAKKDFSVKKGDYQAF